MTTLHNFDGSDGTNPACGLVLGSDGNFYGTIADNGVAPNYGTIYRITPAGVFTTLHTFDGSDGSQSMAPLVQANDGNFYGITYLSTAQATTAARCSR